MSRVVLKPRKARPFFARHPWVLDSAIDRVEGSPQDGEVVELVSERGQWLARGILNSHSRIRVRLYGWRQSEPLDEGFWRRRLGTAIAWRGRFLGDDPERAVRLVYSEADGMSGLIVDRYGEYLVVQVTSLAMAVRLDILLPLLAELTAARGIVVRTDRHAVKQERLAISENVAWGRLPDGPVFIREHGLRYGVDLSAGQKTGFFLDQRDNRLAAASYMGERRVLDVFCYSGGFALCAARHGKAREVTGIDSSEKAIALAQANAELNGVANARFEAADAFQTLESLVARGERFDAVVLDPPKFARNRQTLDEALRAYHLVNRLAVELLEPDGILVTCSCSGHVNREDLLQVLSVVAERTGRDVQILEQRGAAADHPVAATCLESEYLKCFICRVV